MLSLLSNFDNMLKLTTSPQAKRAETDPRQGTPTRARLQTPDAGDERGRTASQACLQGPHRVVEKASQRLLGDLVRPVLIVN